MYLRKDRWFNPYADSRIPSHVSTEHVTSPVIAAHLHLNGGDLNMTPLNYLLWSEEVRFRRGRVKVEMRRPSSLKFLESYGLPMTEKSDSGFGAMEVSVLSVKPEDMIGFYQGDVYPFKVVVAAGSGGFYSLSGFAPNNVGESEGSAFNARFRFWRPEGDTETPGELIVPLNDKTLKMIRIKIARMQFPDGRLPVEEYEAFEDVID